MRTRGKGHGDDVTGRARGTIGRRGRRVASHPIVSIFVTPGVSVSFRYDEKGWSKGGKVPRGDANRAKGRDYPPRARLIDRVPFRGERGGFPSRENSIRELANIFIFKNEHIYIYCFFIYIKHLLREISPVLLTRDLLSFFP